VTAGQPDLGHTIYPVNDHPADKATYTIELDVPEGVTAVASGELLGGGPGAAVVKATRSAR
jgi:aminopeptidase N